MREILFRGKNEKTWQWAYGVPLRCSRKTYIVKDVFWSYDTNGYEQMTAVHEVQVDPDTVGQFTGMLDKNGNKIFEGDILLWDDKEWLGGYNELVRWDYELLSMRENDWGEHCTVVGNKWDNSKLLNP